MGRRRQAYKLEKRGNGIWYVVGQGKRYPPPRKRPPGLTPEEIDAMMDPDRDLDPKR